MIKGSKIDWIIEANPKDKNLKPEFCLPNMLNKFIDLSEYLAKSDNPEENIS